MARRVARVLKAAFARQSLKRGLRLLQNRLYLGLKGSFCSSEFETAIALLMAIPRRSLKGSFCSSEFETIHLWMIHIMDIMVLKAAFARQSLKLHDVGRTPRATMRLKGSFCSSEFETPGRH